MTQSEKARHFKSLHQMGAPLILYNIWDAGSAKAVAKSGARAIATGSWSLAAAQDFDDGEAIPLDLVLQIAARIAQSVDLPLSVDFETGYASDPAGISANTHRLLETGAIGVNFEDQDLKSTGLYTVPDQVARLAAMRAAADHAGVPLFINARTDLFLKSLKTGNHAAYIDEALSRADAYAKAGADGFFVPGLTDPDLIARITEKSPLPVNVMMMGDKISIAQATQCGAARISFGPAPYRNAVQELTQNAFSLTQA
jgi:2-methylisocitrate lyase-like PEP mutase family enzyme